MNRLFSSEQAHNWEEVRQAARALAQAADLIGDANRRLERFCPPTDEENWDRAFAWKLSELKQTSSLCREIEQHLTACIHQATAVSGHVKT